MKYIKLYEAFESQVITNTLKFLTKKVGQNDADFFLSDIKSLMNDFDIPISRIKEDDLEYVRTKKAIDIKGEPVDNEYDIYCIKYWFSIEEGFLGKTCTGNLTTPYIKLENNNSYKNENFNEKQFEFIKNRYGIKKGKLSSVLDYNSLKTGDDVFVVIGDSRNDNPIIGKIFIDEVGYLFVLNGSKSDGVGYSGSKPDFGSAFDYTWRLGTSVATIDNDHYRLHLYTKDDKKIRQEVKFQKIKHKANLADFNKPFERNRIQDWSLSNQHIIEDIIKKSDFAIIIYFDKLLSLPSVPSIKKSRVNARRGATALMTDNEIKNININNYTKKLVDKYKLNQNLEDFSKLNSLINNTMNNKFIMFNLYLGSSINGLTDISECLYKLIVSTTESDKEYYFQRVSTIFKNNRENSEYVGRKFKNNLNQVLESEDERLITLIKRFINIGENINRYIQSIDIENIHDIIMIRYKLTTIASFIQDYKHVLPYSYRDVINGFDSMSGILGYIRYCIDESEEEFNKSMDKLDIIEKFVNSLLK